MNKLNALIAYPYFGSSYELLLKNRDSINLMIDSGAFTAFTSGKPIQLDDYCRFLDSIEKLRPFHAIQLDVIGDPEKTWENFLTMKRRGHDVMPVFTHGDSLERLEEMYNHSNYVLVGGIAQGGKKPNFLKWFMNNNKNRRVHWLGFVKAHFIKYFKPTSCDSSAWLNGTKYGLLQLHDGFGNLNAFNFSDYTTKFRQINEKLERQPYSFKDLKNKDNWKGDTLQKFSTYQNIDRCIAVEKNLGTKIYLATNETCLKHLLTVWEDFKTWKA